MSYRFLAHPSDVKFRADGVDLEEVFVSSAEALNETIRGDIKILEQEKREFEVQGSDKVNLLYNFLEEFLVMLEKDDFLVASIDSLEFNENKLKCVVSGDKAERYKFTNDVKAITYSEMFVRETPKGTGWECQVVLDV
jgi:SHS2 domain-containing protein